MYRHGGGEMDKKKNAYRVLVGKRDGKRPVGRFRHRWEGNIKKDLREIGWDGVDWIFLARNRDHWGFFMTAVKNLQVS
jgi:hypothetical protein